MTVYRFLSTAGTLATSLFLAGGTQAGIITSTTANMPHNPAGFGAWNLDNITVNVTGGSFNEADGSYVIGPDGTYSSSVDDGTGTTETAVVGGKDWPVGEPSGIKVVNDDLAAKAPKPTNCIMTTSYLELPDVLDSGYLDTSNPVQTLCSSGFQTHKRFKVNMGPNSLAPGAAVDLVFNIQPDGTTRNYQVFQKINNYTDKRLEGFKVQVGVGVGSTFQSASAAGLTANLWLSTPLVTTDPVNGIWDPNEIATFSHGLFGPADKHFPEDGFFDNQRAGFFTQITEYTPGTGIGDTLNSTTTQGSNYAQIPPVTGPVEQFGPWLPSIWIPSGIFFDDDNNPDTDAVLKAFWGETAASSGDFQWMQGNAANFAPVPAGTLAAWVNDPAYSVGAIEDLLNLGLNYIVTLGTVDASWPTWDPNTSTATFTIRMIPIEDTSGIGAPSYVANTPPAFVPGVAGVVSIAPQPAFIVSQALIFGVADNDLNTDANTVETVNVTVLNQTTGETEALTLTETGPDRGVFEASLASVFGAAAGTNDDGSMNVIPGHVVEVTYIDANNGSGGFNVAVTATTTAAAGTTGQLNISTSINPGNDLSLSLSDADLNTRTTAIDFATVAVVNDATGETELVTLAETGIDTGVFSNTLTTAAAATAGTDNDAVLNVAAGNTLTTTYIDTADSSGAPATATAATTVAAAPTSSNSSGGGLCSLAGPQARFNPTMPLLLGLVLLFGWARYRYHARRMDGAPANRR